MILKFVEVYRGVVYEIETDPELTYYEACLAIIKLRKDAQDAIDYTLLRT